MTLLRPSATSGDARDAFASDPAAVRSYAPVAADHRRSGLLTYSHQVALLCAAITALAVLAVHPVLEMGTSDDWSYARTSLDFVRTGRIIYNGWATAMLGWQILWGALVIKLFGFSFLVLRLSTLPFAAGAAYLLHRICVRLGLTVKNAALATLTVVLSPLFLPLAASFMTDVPAFFWLLVGVYACLRAISASTNRACILWLGFATVTNVIAGSARQIIWLVAIVMLPSAAWLVRKRPGVLATGALLWTASVIAIAACMHWFYEQPYSIPEKIIAGHFTPAIVPHVLQQMRDMCLSILLLSLPVLSIFLISLRRASKKVFFVSLALGLVLLGVRVHTHGLAAFAPWMPNIVTEYGVGGSGSWESLGLKPITVQPWVRALITCMVLVATCAWLAVLLPGLVSVRRSYAKSHRNPSWIVLSVLLGPFTLAYCGLLMPRATFGVALDRYLVPLIAIFVIVLLRHFQAAFGSQTPGICFGLLSLFTAYGVAATHDYFSTGRARLAAASLVRSAGVPRTEIQGGWEYDGWTQLSAARYINEPRLAIPAGAYKRIDRLKELPAACRFEFAALTPAIDPHYFVVFSPQSCLASSAFPPVAYDTWLPPFHRKIYVQQLRSLD